jgi:hypothetical protein
MKNIITLILISSVRIFSQADLTMDIYIYTSGSGTHQTLLFGLDSTATDGEDTWLGESNLPPDWCAPWGADFCACFALPPFDGMILSWLDFRFGEPPYNGLFTYLVGEMNYDLSTNDSIYIRYDLPEGVSLHFEDIWGGIFINITVEDSGEIGYQDFDGLNSFWMYVNYDNVIPAEISSFTGSFREGNKIELKWSTASETNNKGFSVERNILLSSCGCEKYSEWKSIAFIPGFGTTTEPKSYSFTDDLSLRENVISGIYKYRLKQIDFDGSYNFSKEIEVKVNLTPDKFTLEQNYPNPFNPMTRIKFGLPEAADVTLAIYNSLGQKITELVNSRLEAGSYEYQWNAKDFASGTYIYELRTEKFVSIKKMIYLK